MFWRLEAALTPRVKCLTCLECSLRAVVGQKVMAAHTSSDTLKGLEGISVDQISFVSATCLATFPESLFSISMDCNLIGFAT